MKRILLLIAFIPVFVSAQEFKDNPVIPIDTALHRIIYTGVVQMDGFTKHQMLSSAIEMFAEHFDMAHSSISYYDIATGKLVVHATEFGKRSNGISSFPFSLNFNIYLWFKDGKYKYQMSEFAVLNGLDPNGLPDFYSADVYALDPKYKTRKGDYTTRAKEILNVIDGNVQNIIVTLKAALLSRKYPDQLSDDF